jgi:hypothetical protein
MHQAAAAPGSEPDLDGDRPQERSTMTEHSATIPSAEYSLSGYLVALAPITAEPISSPNVPDDLVNTTGAKP